MTKKQRPNWPQLIAEFKQTGLNQSAFYRQKDLKLSTFNEQLHRHSSKQNPSTFVQVVDNQKLHLFSMLGSNQGTVEQRQQRLYQAANEVCHRQLGKVKWDEAKLWLEGMLDCQLSQCIVRFGLPNQSRNKRLLQQDLLPLCRLWLTCHFAENQLKTPLKVINGQSISGVWQRHADELDYLIQRMLIQLGSRFESIV